MEITVQTDDYGEVVNGENTFKVIAQLLANSIPVMVGWTDGHMSHFDILFTYEAHRYGSQIQGGIHPESDLLVSIMGRGAFGFEVKDEDTHWGYIDGKFGNFFGETTGGELANLINGVKKNLWKEKNSSGH